MKLPFRKKKPEEESVIIGFISGVLEPWYAKKSDVEKWNAEKMDDVI